MKTGIKNTLIFVSGVVIGAASGVLACKKIFEAKADMEIASVKEAYDNRLYELEHDIAKANTKTSLDGGLVGETEIKEEDSLESSVDKTDIKKKVEALNNKPDLMDYTKYFKGEDNAESSSKDAESSEKGTNMDEDLKEGVVDELEELNDLHREAVKTGAKPYVIDAEEYDTMPAYEKMDLLWYMFDDVLADEADEVVDRDLFVGTCIEDSGFNNNDLDALYIRNDRMMLMIEVTKLYDSYAR